MIFGGCATRKVVVVPSDKVAIFLPAGSTHTATNDVWLVPPALMQEMTHALSDKVRANE